MTRKNCSVEGCAARAWHGALCNLHALERHRASARKRRTTGRQVAEGKRLLRQRARELGITLADDTGRGEKAMAEAQVVNGVRMRSPVA